MQARPNRDARTVTVHSPDSLLREPRRLLRDMRSDVRAARALAWRLMVRDISAQYRQTALGLAWAFLPPLVMAAGFTLAADADVLNVGNVEIPYPAYVMFSTALWQTFVEALTGPLDALTRAKTMIARVNFPREAIILAKIGEVLFNFGVKLILIAAIFLWYRVPVSWTILLAPVALMQLILLGIFLGTLVAPFGVLYQDVPRALSMATGFWLFLTPIVYAVPEQGTFGLLVRLNPVTPLLVTTRELATTGEVTAPLAFVLVSCVTIAGLLLTWIALRVAMPRVVERVGA